MRFGHILAGVASVSVFENSSLVDGRVYPTMPGVK